jgi:hypothetical protein
MRGGAQRLAQSVVRVGRLIITGAESRLAGFAQAFQLYSGSSIARRIHGQR